MKVLDVTAEVALVAAVIALPFTFLNLRRRPIMSALILGVPVLLVFGAVNTSRDIAQASLLDELDSISDNCKIWINGRSAPSSHEILSSLRTLTSLLPHHSHPTVRITVEIIEGSKHVVLSLGRDSTNPQEYWVFDPRYFNTRSNEIGRIVTPVFDAY